MSLNVVISSSQVPDGWCFQNWQDSWPFLVTLLSGQVQGNVNTFNLGSTTPSPANQNKPWIRLNADGTPDRIYIYSNGAWISRNPTPVGAITLYDGDESGITTFDGGEAGSITAVAGPMWEKVAELDGRLPMGPGTTANGTVVAVGDTGGEDEHTLITDEMPEHTHKTGVTGQFQSGAQGFFVPYTISTTTDDAQDKATTPTGGGEPHNNLPPYYGIFFIRRTARTHYRI